MGHSCFTPSLNPEPDSILNPFKALSVVPYPTKRWTRQHHVLKRLRQLRNPLSGFDNFGTHWSKCDKNSRYLVQSHLHPPPGCFCFGRSVPGCSHDVLVKNACCCSFHPQLDQVMADSYASVLAPLLAQLPVGGGKVSATKVRDFVQEFNIGLARGLSPGAWVGL